MAEFDRRFVASKVQHLFQQARKQGRGPAPDLFTLAELRRVRMIDIRPMIPSGGLASRDDGFIVYIRDLRLENPNQHVIKEGEEPPVLSPRQRFTLAHELVHTFFFDSESPPAEVAGCPHGSALEQLCQYGARHVLLPDVLMEKVLAQFKPITADFVCAISDQCTVSPEVVLRRLADSGTVEYASPSLLMARIGQQSREATIVAAFVDASLVVHRPRPVLFSDLAAWAGEILNERFWDSKTWRDCIRLNGAELRLQRVPYGSQAFFLEIEVA
jgi:hypothetical protein